ncbi:hypothetical protein [Veillonella magna]|uniref:hypothetical protein n=1 Tax=Veillonella magna TaxID=464322 RepID=UPI0023F41375|nr:hypothetical protein [Veillonella magna]MBD8976589.1 hypothetical protein [Veillonella magna]
MKSTERPIEKRIHTAKSWLDKAERSYADDSSMKGELQLMLAKAELQHLSEKKRSPYMRLSKWTIAVGVCLLIIGGTWTIRFVESETSAGSKPPTASTVTEQRSPVVVETPIQKEVEDKGTATDEKVVHSSVEQAVQEKTERNDVVAEPVQPVVVNDSLPQRTERAQTVSTAQIKQAIREGERSLRGK